MVLHKDRPSTDAEVAACSRELSKEELSKLIIGPKVRMGPSSSDLSSSSRPRTLAHRVACAPRVRALQVVDFGSVSVGSVAVQHLMLVNTLSTPIHVVLDLKALPELKGSKNTSQARARTSCLQGHRAHRAFAFLHCGAQ